MMPIELEPMSVVIPAHNESSGIRRLLVALSAGEKNDLELIVVCNGCSDDTAQQAREAGSHVVVVEVPQPSKSAALAVGNSLATHGFRAWVDADVVITAASLGLLRDALKGRVHVAAPVRDLTLNRSSWMVRWYYDVWNRLPQVGRGVFGRGVVVMTPEGLNRVQKLPRVMSDDLAVSEAFADDERAIVESAHVQIQGPRTVADLIRRRVRVATGNAQLDQLGIRTESARTTPAVLLGIVKSQPTISPKMLVFLVVTIVSRLQARRRIQKGDFTTWLRDESSRTDR